MKWKNRLTNYNFWISIVSAVLLLLQAFDFEFDVLYVNEILTAILGLLVVIGIISDPTKSATESSVEDKKSIEKNCLQNKNEDMPIAEESANIENSNESDLQTVVDKIREDLDKIRLDIDSRTSSPLESGYIESENHIYNIVNE